MSANKEAVRPSEVKPCTCVHKAQDEFHGKQNRVHNPSAKGYKCTVCGNIKSYKN